MRYLILATILAGLLIVGMFGSRGHKFSETPVEVFNDMDRQARVNAQTSSDFFADGLGARKPVEGTFPIGFSIPDKPFEDGDAVEDGFSLTGTYFNSGQIGDYYGDGMPKEIKLDKEFMDRGKQRYGIYCAVCHADSVMVMVLLGLLVMEVRYQLQIYMKQGLPIPRILIIDPMVKCSVLSPWVEVLWVAMVERFLQKTGGQLLRI